MTSSVDLLTIPTAPSKQEDGVNIINNSIHLPSMHPINLVQWISIVVLNMSELEEY